MKPIGVIYSDEQIRKLMYERKVLPNDWEIQLKKSKDVLGSVDIYVRRVRNSAIHT